MILMRIASRDCFFRWSMTVTSGPLLQKLKPIQLVPAGDRNSSEAAIPNSVQADLFLEYFELQRRVTGHVINF